MTEDEMVSITDSIDTNLSKFWEIVEDRGAWHAAVHGVKKSQIVTEQQEKHTHTHTHTHTHLLTIKR